ncbi:MAG TPA: hypothetical protein VLJ39_21675 [Tepidisphaeraceae bacterium]|nr:hypothetical protein [Tepidisphaeraceae bacterium]
MADYQEIPELIRSFIATPGHPWSEDLSDVAMSYATLCREANDRLRRCADFLARGMRSEAVQLADCQPKLIGLAESLKIPDSTAWNAACVAHGLAPAPELLTDSLSQLEVAVEIELRLQPLLARFRLLSLAKSPVRDRMEVLLPLHDKDPGNPVWVENLRTLGTVRLKQIRAEAQTAYRGKDLSTLEGLSAELAGEAWQVDVPDDLKRGVERATGFLRLETAKEELRPLLQELRKAHAEQDYENAAPLMAQWQEIVTSRQLELPKALQDAVRPVVAWISDEERRRNQQQKMDRMRPALQETEKLFRTADRRHRMRMAAVIAFALVLTGVLVYMYVMWIARK